MQDEPEIARSVGTNQRGAIHYAGDFLQSLRNFDVIDRGVDARKSREHLVGGQTSFVRSIALRVECLRVGHPTAHPQDDDRVRRGLDLLLTSASSWRG